MNRAAIRLGYLVGTPLIVMGLTARFFALNIARRMTIRTYYMWSAQEWLPSVADVAQMIALFGMAMVLLTLHHHLRSPPVARSGVGFEPVNVRSREV